MFTPLQNPKFQNYSTAIIHSDMLCVGRTAILHMGRLRQKIFQDTNLQEIFLPGFSYYGTKETFSMTDNAIKMGVFSNECINHLNEENIQRSVNPIHSYIRLTRFKSAQNFNENFNNNLSFGNGSVFEYFRSLNPIWCCLGPSINNGFTIFHHAECLANVPYRKWITFPKKIFDGTKIYVINYKYFARKNNETIDFEKFVKGLVSSGLICCEQYGTSKSFIGDYNEILKCAVTILKNDPYYFIKK